MKRHIVISDPDRQNARLLKALLSKAGYELSYSADPAICRAEISANPPDILITDPLYPSSDGRRLIKAALDAGCGAVIAVSAAAGERAVTDVLDAGADDFIRKPFLSGELLARVRACVRRIEALEEARGESVSAVYLSGGLKVEFNSRRVTVGRRRCASYEKRIQNSRTAVQIFRPCGDRQSYNKNRMGRRNCRRQRNFKGKYSQSAQKD